METLSAETFIRRAAARSSLCRVANLKLSSTPSAFPGYQCSLTKLFLKKRPHSLPAIGHLLAVSSYLAKVNCSLRSGAAGGAKTRGIYANYSQQLPGGRESPGEDDEDSDQPMDENCPSASEPNIVAQSPQQKRDQARSAESAVGSAGSAAAGAAVTVDQERRPPDVGDQGSQLGIDQLDGATSGVDQIDDNDDDDLSSLARDDRDEPDDEDVDQDPEPDTDYPEHREFDRNCCCHRCTDNFIARLFHPDVDQDAENKGARCRSDQAGCPNSILSRPPSRASSPCGSAGNVGPLVAHPGQQGGLPLSLAMPLSTSPLGHSLANIQATTVATSSGPQKQFLCPMCSKCFTQKGNLKTHMMIHTGEKPYSCQICGRSFTQKGNVDTHMKIHTGEKDYGCDSCGKRFARKGNLRTHVRSVHTKERPFACGVCGKCFSQKGNMQTHLRTHNKDDRFPCPLCGKTFSQKGNLKTHMQRHAGQTPSRSKGGGHALHHHGQHFSLGSSVCSGGIFAREPLGVLGELADGADELGPLALSLPPLHASATGSPSGMVDLRAANDDQFSAALASDDSESSSESESESPRPIPVFPGSNGLPLGLSPVFPDSGQPPPHTSWLNPHRSHGPPHGPAMDHTAPPHGEFPRDGDGAQFRRLSSLLSGILPMRHSE